MTSEAGGGAQSRVRASFVLGRLVIESGPQRGAWWFLALLCGLPLVGLPLSAAPSTARVWCSAEALACSSARNDQVLVRLPLREIDHFEVFVFRQSKSWVTELRAVTASGNLLVARGWPSKEFEAAAEGLNEVLSGASALRSFVHEDPGTTLGDRLGLLGLTLILLAPLWLISGPCWLVVDGQGSTATLLWPFRPRRWGVAQLAGVQYWTAWNEVADHAQRTGQAVPYSLTLGDRAWMVLVDRTGRRHRVTRATGGSLGQAELKAAVAQVAKRLGLPAMPPIETPPPGGLR